MSRVITLTNLEAAGLTSPLAWMSIVQVKVERLSRFSVFYVSSGRIRYLNVLCERSLFLTILTLLPLENALKRDVSFFSG